MPVSPGQFTLPGVWYCSVGVGQLSLGCGIAVLGWANCLWGVVLQCWVGSLFNNCLYAFINLTFNIMCLVFFFHLLMFCINTVSLRFAIFTKISTFSDLQALQHRGLGSTLKESGTQRPVVIQ